MSNNKPILHQAVLVKKNGLPEGLLSIPKLFDLGFDVNAVDECGRTALSQIFFTQKQSEFVKEIINYFKHPGA